MTKYFNIYFIILMYSYLFQISVANARVIKICGHHDYPPIMYKENNYITGLAFDAISKIAARNNLKITAKYKGTWKRCLHDLKIGKIDIVIAAYVTDERKKYISFAQTPLIKEDLKVFVLKSNKFNLNKKEDLIGKTTINTLGDSKGETIDNFLNDNFKFPLVKTRFQVVQSLLRERSDFFIAGKYNFTYMLEKLKLENKIIPLDYNISTQDIHIGISKRSTMHRELLDTINKEIEKLKKTAFINSLLKKYTSSNSAN